MANLDRHYAELKQAARGRLGSLCNPADYPETLVGLFGGDVGRPECRAARLAGSSSSPGLYEAERARVAARFE